MSFRSLTPMRPRGDRMPSRRMFDVDTFSWRTDALEADYVHTHAPSRSAAFLPKLVLKCTRFLPPPTSMHARAACTLRTRACTGLCMSV